MTRHPTWHPATLLVVWAAFALLIQWLPLAQILISAVLAVTAGECFARRRFRQILLRARWLLISLVGLFVFLTPGEYLPGLAGETGISYDGLQSAAENGGRLVALLASLALLHEILGTQGLLAALYTLMGWFPARETIVARLLLVLESVEREPRGKWRDWLLAGEEVGEQADVYRLGIPALSWRDRCLILLVLSMWILWWLIR